MNTTIALYGIGNFGYAWLKHFDAMQRSDISLVAFDRNTEVVTHLQQHASHPFLHTGVSLSNAHTIHFASSPQELVRDADIVMLAVTSDATREVISQIKNALKKNVILLNTAKALDTATGKRLSVIVAEEMGDLPYHYALLAGGTIASDLFAHEPLGIDIASTDSTVQQKITEICTSKNLRVYPTNDLLGVEYASAYKSIIAILAGIISGMGFSYGSETHIISRAAGEVADFVTTHLGGQRETFSMERQCWGNDLWMSCTGATRNRAFGELLGKGMSVEAALEKMAGEHKTVEGVRTIAALGAIAAHTQYPLLSFLYRYIEKREIPLHEIEQIIFDSSL